jgi:hypothetical protein
MNVEPGGSKAVSERPLNVDPAALHAATEQIDDHARAFGSAHEAAHALADGVSLGSGAATAALPGMLAAWATHATVFGAHFTRTRRRAPRRC